MSGASRGECREEACERGGKNDVARRGRLVSLAGVLALWSGCAGSAPAETPRARASCEELVLRYRATLAAGTGQCASDEGCAMSGGLDPSAVCGGSTDVETARALARIASESDAAGCPRPGYSCPPIVPRCTDGACR